ncbi:MAG: response regulator [Planctomycetes bacterium]|nr:response regulator [Planctomycetota bacterium]
MSADPPSPPPPADPPSPLGEKPSDLTHVIEQAATAPPDAPRILVVEDTHVVRRIIAYHLIKAGYATVEARDGNEALHLLGAGKIDAVLLDLALPHLDGLSALRQMRQDARYKDLPVIVVTAKNDRAAILQVAALGVSEYVMKPFDKDDILRRLAKFVKPGAVPPAPSEANRERRRSRRIEIPAGQSTVRAKAKGKPPEDRCAVVNLSPEGCAFEWTPKTPSGAAGKGEIAANSAFYPFAGSNPEGATLQLLLEVRDKEHPVLDVGVRVIHVTRPKAGSSEIVGVRFLEIDKAAKTTINKFLYDVRQEQAKSKRGSGGPEGDTTSAGRAP